VIVYGVNHEATGKTAFSNFAVYGADIWNAVGGVTSDQYPGTAAEHLPTTPTPSTFMPTGSADDVTARTASTLQVQA